MANVNDISQRLLIESALMDYSKFLHITDADINELYCKIEKLNEDCFNNEESFALVEKYNLDAITSREELKKRISNMRAQMAEKIFDYYATGDKTDISRHANSIGTVLKDIGIKDGAAKKLAQSICDRKLQDTLTEEENKAFNILNGKNTKRKKETGEKEKVRWADLLAQNINDKIKVLKEKMYLDLQTYQDTDMPNPVIEKMLPEIKANISGIRIVLNYETPKSTKSFREKLRDDFKRLGGSQKTTLKLTGLLAENGKNLIRSPLSRSNYDDFEKLMKDYFGQDNYQKVIDTALGVKTTAADKENLSQERRKSYNAKSQKLYCQLVASLLTQKRQHDLESGNRGTDYGIYIKTVDLQYIRALNNGENNMKLLGFAELNDTRGSGDLKTEYQISRQIVDDTAEKQVVSVHHHLPLGAAHDVITRLQGPMPEDEKLKKCCELVNILGNNCLVVGKDKHQSMEAKGAYEVKPDSEALIFAGRIDWKTINGISDKLPPQLKKAFTENLSPNGKIQDVGLSMQFPESKYMSELRQSLHSENKISLSKVFGRVIS